MSRYDNDPRVTRTSSGYDLGYGWTVTQTPQGWTAQDGDGPIAEGSDRYTTWPMVFSSPDDAIRAVIGDPQ